MILSWPRPITQSPTRWSWTVWLTWQPTAISSDTTAFLCNLMLIIVSIYNWLWWICPTIGPWSLCGEYVRTVQDYYWNSMKGYDSPMWIGLIRLPLSSWPVLSIPNHWCTCGLAETGLAGFIFCLWIIKYLVCRTSNCGCMHLLFLPQAHPIRLVSFAYDVFFLQFRRRSCEIAISFVWWMATVPSVIFCWSINFIVVPLPV